MAASVFVADLVFLAPVARSLTLTALVGEGLHLQEFGCRLSGRNLSHAGVMGLLYCINANVPISGINRNVPLMV